MGDEGEEVVDGGCKQSRAALLFDGRHIPGSQQRLLARRRGLERDRGSVSRYRGRAHAGELSQEAGASEEEVAGGGAEAEEELEAGQGRR